MKLITTILLLMGLSAHLYTQSLKPTIGLQSVPQNTDLICTIPIYTGNFNNSGLQKGDTVPDFTLYTVGGTAVSLATELQSGPVLLVAGSYTCPVFRDRVPNLNLVSQTYAGKLKVFIIYTVEAHPIVDVSPYSGTVWVTSRNQQEGILHRQPATYGERQTLVNIMLQQMNIQPTVLLDGPCNEWWSTYGPAPNNAYLIDTTGVVFAKHGWFNKAPENINCDIDLLLTGIPCGGGQSGGSFTFELVGDSMVSGNPGSVLNAYGRLINNSAMDAEIDVVRTQNNMPTGWGSAMCLDICLAEWEDTTFLLLAPGDTQLYIMYFYTGALPANGHAQISFRNTKVSGNGFIQNFYGATYPVTVAQIPEPNGVKIWPNPFDETIQIAHGLHELAELGISDLAGRMVGRFRLDKGIAAIHLGHLPSGTYLVRTLDSKGQVLAVELLVKR